MGNTAPAAIEPPATPLRQADYAYAFHAAPIALVVATAEGSIVTANVAACELVGRALSELVGADLEALIATSDRGLLAVGGAPSAVDGHRVVQLRESGGVSVEDFERRLRHERAIAACANALLRAEEDRDLQPALEALLGAAEVTSLFVEVNVDDPELGPCTSLIHEVSQPWPVSSREYWERMPWSRMPDSYAVLSRGEIFVMDPDKLGPDEASVYEGIQVFAEVDAPVYVHGEWTGLVGFADRHRARNWDRGEIRLLRTAAQMLGAFWEKRAARDELVATLADAEKRVRYEHALFEASRALQSTTDEAALPTAIDALLSATKGNYGFVEHNVLDPELGWCTEILHTSVMHDDGSVEHRIDPYWARVAWSRMPDSHARLSLGEPFVFHREDLGPVERATYEGDDLLVYSEVDIPVFVEGEWVGLVGFSDTREPRDWEQADVLLLRTAADMIGAFWARQRAEARLHKLVKSKDEFLAGVSHELRTPLTTVVGLSAELRDRPGDFTPAVRQELVGLIAAESSEMAGLVADLLVAARDDVDAVSVHPEPVDLAEEFESVAHALAESHHVSVDASAGGRAWADPIRVRQILRNLTTNAARYGGKRVQFVVERRGGVVIATVHDDGEPISEGDRDRIFDAYHRAHEPGSQPSAVGLGLTVSRRLARLMGGELRYRAEGGNVFELELPAAP